MHYGMNLPTHRERVDTKKESEDVSLRERREEHTTLSLRFKNGNHTGRLFPDRIGCNDDVEYFAFTIRFDDDGNSSESSDERSAPILRDTELKEHRDASIFTLNVNLNLPEEEEYSGSEVFFREFPSVGDDAFTEDDDNVGILRFTPGMAIVHLGAHRHGSLPITTTPPTSGND